MIPLTPLLVSPGSMSLAHSPLQNSYLCFYVMLNHFSYVSPTSEGEGVTHFSPVPLLTSAAALMVAFEQVDVYKPANCLSYRPVSTLKAGVWSHYYSLEYLL